MADRGKLEGLRSGVGSPDDFDERDAARIAEQVLEAPPYNGEHDAAHMVDERRRWRS